MNKLYSTLLTGALCAVTVGFTHSLSAQTNRSFDGFGNNTSNPDWGAVNQTLVRWADPCYGDSISTPAGAGRLSPRIISNDLFDQRVGLLDTIMGLSDFCWVFGQFVDHDITLTPDGPEFSYIQVPVGDSLFDPHNTGAALIAMHRSGHVPGTGTDITNPRQHPNAITAFVDGSNVYGSSAAHAAWLRTFVDGKLKTSPGNLLPYNTLDGTQNTDVDPSAPHMDNPLPFFTKIFVGGDARTNENPLLSTLHTLFLREHNRLCDMLAARNPSLTDEELYQRARKLNGGILQSILYNEWLPAMGIQLAPYSGYDPAVNPAIANAFGAAAFRMGHTLLNGQLRRLNPDGTVHAGGHMALRDAYFNPTAIPATGGIDPFIKGMAEQTQQSFDARMIDDVRNFLFGRPGRGGLDLAAININRGRERGLPDYNSMREALGLTRVANFTDINSDVVVQSTLQNLYGSIDSIDAWVGMLAEEAMPDKLFGPLVNEAMMRQFTALRDGDRYFYLNDPALSLADRAVISSTRLSDVIRRNTDVDIMQNNVFTSMLHTEVPACTASTASADLTTHISLLNGNPVEGVTVRLYGMDDVMPQTVTTLAGDADFVSVPTCDDYTIEAIRTSDPDAGVTSYDLYLIGQHVLDVTPITDSYQLLAADVNRSGTLSAFDMTNIRRVILGLDTTFFGQASWRFLDTAVAPAAGDNPLQFAWKEEVELQLYDGVATAQLTAVKIGDVNQSLTFAPRLQPRSVVAYQLEQLEDQRQLRLVSTATEEVAAQFELVVQGAGHIAAVAGLDEGDYLLLDGGRTLRVATLPTAEALAITITTSEPGAQLALTSFEPLSYDAAGNARRIQLQQGASATAEAQVATLSPTLLTDVATLQTTIDLSAGATAFVCLDALGREVLRKPLIDQQLLLRRNELPSVAASYRWIIERDGEVLESGSVITAE